MFEYNELLKQAGIGVFILDNFRSQQYGYRALKLLISYSWTNLDLLFLFANIKEHNMISINLFTKLGFSYINNTLYQLSR